MARAGYNAKDNTWTTRDGDTYKLEELDEDHLSNIAAYIARNADGYYKRARLQYEHIVIWEGEEGVKPGEYDTSFEWLCNEHKPYIAICEEMKRRGFVE